MNFKFRESVFTLQFFQSLSKIPHHHHHKVKRPKTNFTILQISEVFVFCKHDTRPIVSDVNDKLFCQRVFVYKSRTGWDTVLDEKEPTSIKES